MKTIVILALTAFASLASAHSAYWNCAAASGSNEAALANCGTRDHFDNTGRLGGAVGHQQREERRNDYGYGRNDYGYGRGGYGHHRR